MVLTWSADKRGEMRAETPMTFKTAAEAGGRAERSKSRFAAVAQLGQGYDVDTEQADENPAAPFQSGRTPAEFDE